MESSIAVRAGAFPAAAENRGELLNRFSAPDGFLRCWLSPPLGSRPIPRLEDGHPSPGGYPAGGRLPPWACTLWSGPYLGPAPFRQALPPGAVSVSPRLTPFHPWETAPPRFTPVSPPARVSGHNLRWHPRIGTPSAVSVAGSPPLLTHRRRSKVRGSVYTGRGEGWAARAAMPPAKFCDRICSALLAPSTERTRAST